MLQRPTQTAAFWRDQFEVSADDTEFLYQLLLDSQKAMRLRELAAALIGEYLRRENTRIEQELAKGAVYVPKNRYTVGQKVVFPALEFAVGEVTEVRPGQNPEHGDFEVITVQFDGKQKPREFAAALQSAHRLNQANGDRLLHDDALLSADEIYKLYQAEINESLLYALEEGARAADFVSVDGNWLLADMLAEVHVGHLNIAEALIEMQGQPVSATQLLTEVELDSNVSPGMQATSLNHALGKDSRFVRLNDAAGPLWFLRRMQPTEVQTPPLLLRYRPTPYNRALLSVEMLQLEWELDDEWGESSLSSEVPSVVPSTSLMLIYPHRRYGTLPLSGRTRGFFPQGASGVSMVTLVDGRWGTRYNGWVVHEGRYVAGLAKWMEDHQIPVGAFITLERTAVANEVIVDFRTRRAKREWARMAHADLAGNALLFEMNKVQVACEYDETMIVAEQDVAALDQLAVQAQQEGADVTRMVAQVTPELIKLNPQGTVHAKSVYSAVNMVLRTPPGPVFYALLSNRRFRDVGGGLFALN
ncbi:MAG: hypothetical protein M9936_05755 [Caldilinea sp.]|nr:hypothetical protein [Caldilinea sp.]MCB0067875.1 hypothetical protein [Caldilineaceae bacterium]MCB0040971.1 hypothetical protein [Caldilinea sp.]MCB0151520.1 hypothetical protein [Caldilineaceae bacterium]MCB9119829.1 hypothetical protein [Caldilineaceae bacterium]